MMSWHNKNSGKHPDDPDYNQNYDPDEEYERYLEELEWKEMKREGN